MNPYIKEYNQYKKNSIMTASPETVLIMLYSGAIKYLSFAKVAIQDKKIEECHTNMMKVQKILRELDSSLDVDNGGDVAFNLHRLYDYMQHRLVDANVKKDVAIVDEVLKYLRDLKDTWEKAIAISARENKMLMEEEGESLTDRSA